MGEILDFKGPKTTVAFPEFSNPAADNECELEYDPKPGSVGVLVTTDAQGVAHFTVTAPAEEVGEAIKQAKDGLAATFGVPADATTLEAIRAQMGEGTFDAFITTFVQRHFFAKALLRTSVLPFLDPDHLTSELPVEGQDYVFKMECLLRPSYDLSSYEPVSVKVPDKQAVSSKDVTAYLDNMSKELATWENDPSATQVERGSHVSLNLDSTLDGKPFPQLTGRHVPYLVGSGQLGDEFDDQLVGMAPRERKEYGLSLPMPAKDGSINYQVVQVKVQIDEIQHSVPAVIDDGWVMKNLPEAQTLLGLRSKVRTMLERQADAAQHAQLLELTAAELATRLQGEPDERYVAKMRDELLSETMQRLQMQGLTLDDVFAQPGFDHEAWEADLNTQAKDALRRGLALDSLADHLDIQLDEKDISAVVSQMAPGHEQEAYQGLLDSGQMPKMCEMALRMRANEWLVDHLPKTVASTGSVILGGGEARPRTDRPAGDGPKLTLL